MRDRVVSRIASVGVALVMSVLACSRTLADDPELAGPDVVYTNCTSVAGYGPVNGVRAYALGSNTCNIGTQNLLWTSDGTPALAMNAFRLHNGRLMQIGQSWCKTACCAAAGSGCGMTCNGQGGQWLGVGCMDVYGSSYNGIQGNLAARSGINAYTGTVTPPPPGSGDAIWRRLQIAESDLTAANFPGAQYFVEGMYIATDDAPAGNAYNNASYKRVTVGASFALTVSGAMFTYTPAIQAWHDHGLGANSPDNSVQILNVNVPNEGRFVTASKAIDNGNGTWRYEYGIYNFNSHRSGGSFAVPLSPGTVVTNVGFHDVNYHSGEPYDNTDWTSTEGNGSLTWQSPQTFAQNANSNALRWGTLYNFWFDADQPPGDGNATIGLFRPGNAGDPVDVSFGTLVPVDPPCLSDIGGDNQVGPADLLEVINTWGTCVDPENCPGDIAPPGGDKEVDVNDVLAVINAWGPCP